MNNFEPYLQALNNLRKVLSTAKSALITTHRRPDGDALGTEAALARLLQHRGLRVTLWNPSPTPANYAFLLAGLKELPPEEIPDLKNTDLVFLVDAADLSRTGNRQEKLLGAFPGTKILLDHHRPTSGGAEFSIHLVDSALPAAGELLMRVARDLGWPLDRSIAEALWVALYTDSGGFHYPATTAATLRRAAELLALEVDPADLFVRIYHNQTPQVLKLFARAAENLELLSRGRLALMSVSRELYRETGTDSGDTEMFVNRILQLAGVQMAVLLYAVEGGTKVSLRSLPPYSSYLGARELGGGGHLNAAAALVPRELPELREYFHTLAADLDRFRVQLPPTVQMSSAAVYES